MNSKEGNSNEDDKHSQYAMQLVGASILPMVLKATNDLGVLEIIQRAGPSALLSAFQIASQLPTHKNSDAPFILDRILRLLASYSILTCSLVTNDHDGKVHRLYGLAPVAKYFIRNQDGGSFAPFLDLIQDKTMIDIWYHLNDAVLEGGLPFEKAHGMNVIEYIGKDARFSEFFKSGSRVFNPIFTEKMLEMYKGFDGIKSLVDVGGGNGFVLNKIISKYPTIKGINYDLAPVIENSPSYPGVEHVAGDMFVSIPKGDAIFMKWILHSWNDEQCLKILKNCYEALPVNGKVVVVDLVVPEAPEASVAVKSMFQFDLFLMNINPKGKERTKRDFENLAKEAGFSHIQVTCCVYNYSSVVEFYKSV